MSQADIEAQRALETELAELQAKNEAATSWGAGVGYRHKRIKEIQSKLRRLDLAPEEQRKALLELAGRLASAEKRYAIGLAGTQVECIMISFTFGERDAMAAALRQAAKEPDGAAQAPMDDRAGIEWFERTFGVPLGDKPGAADVERVRAAAVPSAQCVPLNKKTRCEECNLLVPCADPACPNAALTSTLRETP